MNQRREAACAEGTFQNEYGQSTYKSCSDSDFANVICPSCTDFDSDAFWSSTAQPNCDMCNKNFFRSEELCLPCDKTQIEGCNQVGLEVATLDLRPGFWRTSEDGIVFEDCVKLALTQGCAGGPHNGTANCREGHSGRLCAICIEDYYLLGEKCMACEGSIEPFHVYLI